MIDNFLVIEDFMQFEDNTFYKFELLVRNTDGDNALFREGCSKTNKNIHIKSWYVDNELYYEKIKHEMIALANLIGARLYITLDRKGSLQLVQNSIHDFTNILYNVISGNSTTIKKISKIFASESSKVESSCANTRTIMFDVDTKNSNVYNAVQDYIYSKKQQPYTLQTKKGYHVFCYKKFKFADWESFIQEKYETYCKEINEEPQDIKQLVSVKENELGLVYHPMEKSLGNFYNQLLNVITPYIGDFTGYDENNKCFNIIKAIEELLKDAYGSESKIF